MSAQLQPVAARWDGAMYECWCAYRDSLLDAGFDPLEWDDLPSVSRAAFSAFCTALESGCGVEDAYAQRAQLLLWLGYKAVAWDALPEWRRSAFDAAAAELINPKQSARR